MNRTAKLALGAVAFLVPIGAGLVATGGLDGIDGSDDGRNHQVDQFAVEVNGDEYDVFREDLDGMLTEIITGPDGEVVTSEELSAEVADVIANWEDDPWSEFDTSGSTACYRILYTPPIEGGFAMETTDSMAWLLRASAGADIEAVSLESGDRGHDALMAHIDSDAPLVDVPGATPIGECS